MRLPCHSRADRLFAGPVPERVAEVAAGDGLRGGGRAVVHSAPGFQLQPLLRLH